MFVDYEASNKNRHKIPYRVCRRAFVIRDGFLCFDHTRERARALDGVAFAYARCMNFEGQEVDYNPQARVYAQYKGVF